MFGESVDQTIQKESPFQSCPLHQPVHHDHNERIRIMAERQSKGQCIWTGKPLKPEAIKEDDE